MNENRLLDNLRISETRKRELGKLVVSFVLVIVSAWYLSGILAEGWESRGVFWHLLYGGSRALGVGIDSTVVLFVGLFVGQLAMLWLDEYKRFQAALLSFGTVVGVAGLIQQGQFVAVDVVPTLGSAGVGLAVGVLLGSGGRFEQQRPRRFPAAADNIFRFIAAIVVLGVLEYHVRYVSPLRFVDGLPMVSPPDPSTFEFVGEGLIFNGAAVVILLVLLYGFTRYDTQKNFVVLGPRRSGKTTLMTGLLAHLRGERLKNDEQGTAGNSQLRRRVNLLGSADEGFGDVDLGTNPEDAIPLELNYTHGDIFPHHVVVRTMDYAGENLNNELVQSVKARIDEARLSIPFASALGSPFLRFRQVAYDFPEEELTDLAEEDLHYELANLIHDADTLVLLLPLDEYVEGVVPEHLLPEYFNGPPERNLDYIDIYTDIVDEYQKAGKGKDVIIVATMADLAKEHFEESWGEFVEDWPVFRRYITHDLLDQMEIDGLKLLTDDDGLIYPVYFEPNAQNPTTSEGGINPKQPGGRVNVEGADELLDALGRA